MALEKIGTSLIQKTSAWLRAGGKHCVLDTMPIKPTELKKFKFAPIGQDVVQFSTKEIKLDDELFKFLPWRRGYEKLPPSGKPPLYTSEAKEATETFIERGWIEEPLPNGFRTPFGGYRAFEANGLPKDVFKNLSTGREFLYFNEESKGLNMMVKKLEKIYSDNPNLTEEQKTKILHKFVDSCYDKNRARWVAEFSSDFIPIENTAASGSGVCRHKSFLAKVLGDKLGLHVAMARGHYNINPELGIYESHIWNEVKIKDKWYLMDIEQGRFEDLAKFSEFSNLYMYKS